MNARLGLAVLGAALALTAPAWADDVAEPSAEAKGKVVWAADFDKAVEQAKLEKKDLLVDFTGSDWCGWCIRLHEEVFAHDDFLGAAQKDYVLVALDYPRDEAVKAKVPNPARNAELSQKYGIRGFPTVLLMTADGEVFGKTGYQEGGSAKYVEHIAKLRAEGLPELKTAKEMVSAIEAAKGTEKVAVADKAIAWLGALPAESSLDVVRVLPVKAAFAGDPENKQGIALKAARALYRAGAADDAVAAAAEAFDPKNENGLLEQAVAGKAMKLRSIEDVKAFVKACDDLYALGDIKDKTLAKQIAANCMFMNHKHLKDAEKAKVYAKKVQDLGFEESEAGLKKLVEEILAAGAPAPEKTDK